MRPLSLPDLIQNYSKINIIDIVGMKPMNDTKVLEMCKALSGSINHIGISQIEGSLGDTLKGKKNTILKLINSFPDSSKVIIKDSGFVGLNDDNIDLRRISFKNIRQLYIRRCGLKGGTELVIENIGVLFLSEFSNELIESIDLEAGNIKSYYLRDTAVKLANRTINTQTFFSTGGLDLSECQVHWNIRVF
jgi:hypothetical protein